MTSRFVVGLVAAVAVWAGSGALGAESDKQQSSSFVDENGDGVDDRAAVNARTAAASVPGARGLFLDEDADGVNDLSQDADGDGVANGMDPDYLKEKGIAVGRGWMGHAFVDVDADGVNDLVQDADGDGIPNGLDADYALPEGAVGTAFGGHHGGARGFVDADGDGIHDLAQDADGDGIPNGADADYVLPARLSRGGLGHGSGMMGSGPGFVDEDGDGINDLMQDADGDGVVNGMDADYVRSPAAVRRGAGGGGMMGRGAGFVDVDGDGINDLMLDADGDGVPNGMDGDYALPEGMQRGRFHGGPGMMGFAGFSDADQNGVNDLMQDADGDGVLNAMDADYVAPAGTGMGPGGMGGGMMGGQNGMMGRGRGPNSGQRGTPPGGPEAPADESSKSEKK